jgi:hypothetical protein
MLRIICGKALYDTVTNIAVVLGGCGACACHTRSCSPDTRADGYDDIHNIREQADVNCVDARNTAAGVLLLRKPSETPTPIASRDRCPIGCYSAFRLFV